MTAKIQKAIVRATIASNNQKTEKCKQYMPALFKQLPDKGISLLEGTKVKKMVENPIAHTLDRIK